MPTYEYQCGTCGYHFEKIQSFSEEPVKSCPQCGEPVKKVFSPAGIIFKGSGWYITDSKKSGSVATAPAKDKESSESSSPATTETKSETSSESSAPKTGGDSAKTEAA